MRVRREFFTSPKLRIRAKLPQKYPKGYPADPKTLGEHIRKHRMDLGLFQKDVAKYVGVATDTIINWEKNRCLPSKTYLQKIEKFLKVKG